MRALSLDGVRSVLLLGAHSDDIEIGCGGTVLRLLERAQSRGIRALDRVQRRGKSRARSGGLGRALPRRSRCPHCRGAPVPGRFVPSEQARIKAYFEELKAKVDPDVVFTHYREDLHQDHRVVNELTWNTYRRHTVLEYEVPKWDGDLGTPNVYAPLSEDQARQKVKILMDCFGTQRGKHWFDEETFTALMRLRALECNAESKRAEAFYGRKVTI
jgi:LmbE family N-acetylglucosaminyl deacetylase